jgi:fumarate reductase subunit D
MGARGKLLAPFFLCCILVSVKKHTKKIRGESIYFKTYLIGMLSSVFLVPILVFAQRKYEQSIFGLFEYTKDIVDDLILWLFTTGAVVFFLWKIVVQIYKISQGEKVDASFKHFLVYGLIALTVMFTFYAVTSLLAVTFGIQIGIPQFFQNQDGLSPGSGQIQNTRGIITY